MKIEAKLNKFETETLFDLFHHAITENRELAKLNFLSGEISKSRLDWHLGHADYLEGIKNKLLNKK